MKKNLLLVLISLLSLSAFTQSYSVDWGPEYRKQGGLFSSFFMAGMTGDNYHLIMQPKRDKTLLTFDLDHKLVKNQGLEYKVDGNELSFNQFIKTSSGTFALFNAHQRRKSDWKLYVSSFEDNKIGRPQLTYQHSFDGPRFVGYRYQPYFLNNLELSPDSNKVSFVNVLDFKETKGSAKFAIAVFDENMNLEWEKIQHLPYPDRKLKLLQSVVNNDGDVFILTKLYEKERPLITFSFFASDGLPIYDYKVFKVTENGIEEFNIKLENNVLAVDAGIFIPNNLEDAFILGGFYTTDDKRSGLNGLFLASVNAQSGQVSSSTHVLEPEFLEGLISRRDLRKERGLNSSFRIRNLLNFSDGSFAFLAEEFYTTTSRYMDSDGSWRERIVYHTDQIVIPRFNKNGELVNVEKIDKTFQSESFSAVSYSMALHNGKIFLVYTDLKNRGERKELRQSGAKRGRYTDMTVINEEGEIEFQETLFSSKDAELLFLPRESEYSDGHLIILGTSGFGRKRYKCGTIELH